VTERYGTISEDLVEREAQRLVQYRAQAAVRWRTGPRTGPEARCVEL